MRLNREAILNLWAAGKPAAEIAAELGCHFSSVFSVVTAARASGDKRASRRTQGRRSKPSRTIQFRLCNEEADALFAEAQRRSTTPTSLCRRLIQIIVRDSMFQAVLDTRGGK